MEITVPQGLLVIKIKYTSGSPKGSFAFYDDLLLDIFFALQMSNIPVHLLVEERYLKTVDTVGNCERPVFSLRVSQHMHKIINL